MEATTSQGVDSTVDTSKTTDQAAPPAVEVRQYWGNSVNIDPKTGRIADGKSAQVAGQLIVIMDILRLMAAAASAAKEEGLVIDLSNPGNLLDLVAVARKSSNFTFAIPVSDNPNDGVVATNLPGLVSKPNRKMVRKGLAAHK